MKSSVLCNKTKGRVDAFFHLPTTKQILLVKKKMIKVKRISPKKLAI